MFRKLLPMLSLFALPVTATASDQVFTYQGVQQSVSETLTNPYTLATVTLDGTYNVNVGTYNGTGTGNSLLMTNFSDLLLLDANGVQSLSDLFRIVLGNGNDVVDLASLDFSVPNLSIFGGVGKQTIWGNGNDTIDPGTGHDVIDGGPGVNTVGYNSPLALFTITRTGSNSFTIASLDGSTIDALSDVKFAKFADQTIDLSTVAPVPVPPSLWLLLSGLAVLWAFGRIAVAGNLGIQSLVPSPGIEPG